MESSLEPTNPNQNGPARRLVSTRATDETVGDTRKPGSRCRKTKEAVVALNGNLSISGWVGVESGGNTHVTASVGTVSTAYSLQPIQPTGSLPQFLLPKFLSLSCRQNMHVSPKTLACRCVHTSKTSDIYMTVWTDNGQPTADSVYLSSMSVIWGKTQYVK